MQSAALMGALRLQAPFLAVTAYLHCKAEPGDTCTAALVATLRKRLTLAREAVPPHVRKLQVRMGFCVNPKPSRQACVIVTACRQAH